MLRTLTGALLALAALTASAQPFVDLAFGKAFANLSDFEEQGFSSDRSDTTWAVSVGYMLHPLIGVEAGYRDLGEFGLRSSGPHTGAIGGFRVNGLTNPTIRMATKGFFAGPLFETYIQRVLLNARVGAYFWTTDAEASGTAGTFDNQDVTAGNVTSKDTGVSVYAGGGIAYRVVGGASLGLNYTRYHVADDIKVNCWDLRLKYLF